MKNIFKRAACVLLIICSLLSLSSCITPSRKMYLSKEKNASAKKVTALIADAAAKTNTISDIKYTYEFFVQCDINDTLYKLGTENVISIKGRNTENMSAHRINTSTGVKGETQTKSPSEEFFYSDGNIYTTRSTRSSEAR